MSPSRFSTSSSCWLNRPEPNLEEARTTLAGILEASGRATKVVARIRSLARKGDPNHVILDLNEVARKALLLVQRELQTHDVTLRVELTDDIPTVRGDRVQLQQVIINLLMNGTQAMRGTTGEMLLVLRTSVESDGHVTLTVSDTGAGVAPENEARLFEPFFTTKSDGMGIGLSICRSIVDAHQGRLKLRTDARITKGATLALSLPACSESVERMTGTSAEASARSSAEDATSARGTTAASAATVGVDDTAHRTRSITLTP
jgi:two-component system, LuxR family, sensor kinase FixL